MPLARFTISTQQRFNFALLAVFLLLIMLMGGGSRPDILSHPIVRLIAILMLAVWAFQLRGPDFVRVREPLLFLGVAFALVAIQLIPLPPGLWTALPGREIFVEGYRVAGIDPGWQPISLTPDGTLNTLLALLPALAAAVGLALVDRERSRALVLLLIGVVMLSGLAAVAQISTGNLYLYRITNQGWAVGLFANRNHQALLIAIAFPLLACWAAMPHQDERYRRMRMWMALIAGMFLIPLLFVTGSRAGLLLGTVGGLIAFALLRRNRGKSGRPATLWSRLMFLVPILIGAAALAATFLLGRDRAVQRLIDNQDVFDLRLENIERYVRIMFDFMPLGSGFGSFDPIYRIYEPEHQLSATYLNHAHNDLAQVGIEGGLPALVLVAVFLVWFLRRLWQLWVREGSDSTASIGRAGSAIAVLILMSSLVDYPLRTPFYSVLMVLALVWMLPTRPSALGGAAKARLAAPAASSNYLRDGRKSADVDPEVVES